MDRIMNKQSGFTMVEALVALVVLAIGLLGIAALYLHSLRAGRTAIYRTQGVTLAADLADRIRANRTAIAAYNSTLAQAHAEVATCFTTAGCTAAQLAESDLSRWKNSLALQLPGGQGQVTATAPVGAGQPATYVIVVQWSEVGEAAPVQFRVGVST